MTHKQLKFITEYTKDFNATQAAIRAGYSKKSAYSIGQELLKNPEIKNAMSECRNGMIADRNERLKFWTDIMRDESQELKHRLRASELLGKAQADFTEKVEMKAKPQTLADLMIEEYSRKWN